MSGYFQPVAFSPDDRASHIQSRHNRKMVLLLLSLCLSIALMIIAAYSISSVGQSTALSSLQSNARQVQPTPTVTPMPFDQSFEGQWFSSGNSYASKVTPGSVLITLLLVAVLAVGLILVFLYVYNTVFLSLFDSRQAMDFARHSLLGSILFLLVMGYMQLLKALVRAFRNAGTNLDPAPKILKILNPIATILNPIVAVCLFLSVLLGVIGMGMLLYERGILVQTIILIVAGGFFPLSYVTYQYMRVFARSDSVHNTDALDSDGWGNLWQAQSAPLQPVTVERLALDFLLSSPGARFMKEETGEIFDYEVLDVYKRKAARYYHKFYSWRAYLLYIVLNILLIFIGLFIFFFNIPQIPDGSWLKVDTVNAMRFGFLGGLVFSAQLIYRRITTNDLLPSVYMYTVISLVGGAVFNLVAFQALSTLIENNGSQVVGEGAFAIVAFALGYFPFWAIRWFNQVASQMLRREQGQSEQISLDKIAGIESLHEARLRDLGIDNIENLASYDLHELITATPFGSQQIVGWIDQAILLMHLNPGEMEVFRTSGIQTASDFWKWWESIHKNKNAETLAAQRRDLALQLQSSEERLASLYDNAKNGPNVNVVETFWSRKRFEGALAVALDRTQLEAIRKEYYSVLEHAGRQYEMSQSKDGPASYDAFLPYARRANELREDYRKLYRSDFNLPDPTSKHGKKGLELVYLLAQKEWEKRQPASKSGTAKDEVL